MSNMFWYDNYTSLSLYYPTAAEVPEKSNGLERKREEMTQFQARFRDGKLTRELLSEITHLLLV